MLSAAQTTERRSILRRLDDLLEALEQLNLRETTKLTDRIRRSLTAQGIPYEDATEIRVLIERVWRKQELHMGTARPDRRKAPNRRSVGRRHSGHDVIESIIRQSHQGPD